MTLPSPPVTQLPRIDDDDLALLAVAAPDGGRRRRGARRGHRLGTVGAAGRSVRRRPRRRRGGARRAAALPGSGCSARRSGLHRPGGGLVAIVDPLDGSTNASRRRAVVRDVAVHRRRPTARGSALVADQAGLVGGGSRRYWAERGGGAWLGDGSPRRVRRASISATRSSGCPACRRATSAGASSARSGRRRSTCAWSPPARSTGSSTAAPTPTGCGTTRRER